MGPWGHKELDTIEHACQCTELARVMQGNINFFFNVQITINNRRKCGIKSN